MQKKEFNPWQDHSMRYLEMAFRADKGQIPEHFDGHGRRKGQCGDTIEMFITVAGEKIQSVAVHTDGCMNTNACANTVACLAEGKTIEKAWEITVEKVVQYLETLPPHETHCAELAVGAFYLALQNVQELKKAPWKKTYCCGRVKSTPGRTS